MKTVNLKLSESEAEVLQTALLHTRPEYLGTQDRAIINHFLQSLAGFERPLSEQSLHKIAHTEIIRRRFNREITA